MHILVIYMRSKFVNGEMYIETKKALKGMFNYLFFVRMKLLKSKETISFQKMIPQLPGKVHKLFYSLLYSLANLPS